jgi:hypothetical protein
MPSTSTTGFVLLIIMLCACAVHSAFVPATGGITLLRSGLGIRAPSRPVNRMASMGDVWSDIEHMTRLLDENRASTRGVLARKKQLYGGYMGSTNVNRSMREHLWLNVRLNKLADREEEIQAELERLVVSALVCQMNGGKGRPGAVP